jgi:hypothetical protein
MSKRHEVEIHRLHPTQMTVGMIEVEDKRAKLAALARHELRDFMAGHPIPAVWGPDDKLYLIDHHHLARAASEADVPTGFFEVEDDLSKLEFKQFWTRMSLARWAHPIDERGKVQAFDDIPKHVEKLKDDVYRSLAGYVRAQGGFEKTPTAFAEFQWADFFRSRVPVGPTREDFDRAVEKALKLAVSPVAAALPGFKGSRPT